MNKLPFDYLADRVESNATKCIQIGKDIINGRIKLETEEGRRQLATYFDIGGYIMGICEIVPVLLATAEAETLGSLASWNRLVQLCDYFKSDYEYQKKEIQKLL